MKNFYEQVLLKDVDLIVDEKALFDYVAPNSIHSDVTTWAYGEALERKCVDISDGKVVNATVSLDDEDLRYYVKVIACLSDWKKYENSLCIKVNGKIVVDRDDVFFENVNLGWPAVYFAVPENYLVKGENAIEISTTNSSNGGLYLSKVTMVGYPKFYQGAQVSFRKFVKTFDKFGVALYDVQNKFIGVKNLNNCKYIKNHRYKDFVILSFESLDVGEISCTADFSGEEISLDMPKALVNEDFFIFGVDSDDHRHDDCDETRFITESNIFTDMGDYFQFRPQINRNFHTILCREEYEEYLELIKAFGMKFGLCDWDRVLDYMPSVSPENFLGFHIHEPYLYFNHDLDKDPELKKCFLNDPERILSSKSFGETRKMYQDVLSQSQKNFAGKEGLTSVGSPSILCVYEADMGFERVTIEPVSNINLLTGAVRPTSAKMWGAHVPTDWYFGIPVDDVKSNKHRLAMQYLYLNGASYIYVENSIYKTNAYERCDWEDRFTTLNRQYQREFYNYALEHPRRGEIVVDKAILYGKNEFFMWKTNDRIAELKEPKDWDSYVWGKWDNAHHVTWLASEAWLPMSDKQNVFKDPVNKEIFSGTPFGNVDVVSVEKDLSKYKVLAMLGWNTMDDDLLEKITKYVYNGGKLVISYCHFNYTDVNDQAFVYPTSDSIKDFIGLDIMGAVEMANTVKFEDGTSIKVNSNPELVYGDVTTAKIICKDADGNGVVYKNTYGAGEVYFMAFKDYFTKESEVEISKHLLTLIGKDGDVVCDNNNVSFTVRDCGDEYLIHVLNMNCIPGSDEAFTLNFNGEVIKDTICVGEIKEYLIKK